MTTIALDGRSLTLEEVEQVARGGARAALGPEARRRMRRSRAVVERALERGEVIYGLTTGVGKMSDVILTREESEVLQVNLLRSHAAGLGAPLASDETRAMLLLRANVLARGHSGVRPEVAELLIAMLNRGVHPVIPEKGSVGASGDLAPLAHLGLVLIGEGEAWQDGRRVPGGEALRRAGLRALQLLPKEALSLINGTQLMAAVGTLALLRAERLVETAEVAGAMSLEALMGTDRAFDPRFDRVRPHPGHRTSAARLRALTRGSAIIRSHRSCSRVQDAYSLRCMPQVHGAVRDACGFVRQVLAVEVNAATDNPLIFADAGRARVLAGGNFHGQPVALACDLLAIATSQLAGISERRIERLVNPDLSGLSPFLAERPGLHSGFMMAQVSAASLVSENKGLSHPASVDSIPTSGGKEDFVSMGAWAARKARQVVQNAEEVVAIELLVAAQALDLRRPLGPGAGTARARDLVRRRVPRLAEDRPLTPDIQAVVELLRAGRFAQIARGDRR